MSVQEENMETGVSAATLSFHSQTLEDLLDLDMEDDASSNELGRQILETKKKKKVCSLHFNCFFWTILIVFFFNLDKDGLDLLSV